MATYGEFYFNVLEKTSNDYLALHNLHSLHQLDRKINCYQQFNKAPNQYYQCFRDIEQQREGDATTLNHDYSIIED